MTSQLDIISAGAWEKAFFTTYALSLGFFEAVVLDALVRGGSKQAAILADCEGVRAALSEHGAQRVGRDYEVEPVAVRGGVFHPKITVLQSTDDCHLLVGSGNLTFGGWGMNMEVLEHLHPSFAADAFEDAADFFEYMTVAEKIRHGASNHCEEAAHYLRAAAKSQTRDGGIRLFHTLGNTISDKLVEAVDDLGGAVSLTVAAPYWDRGKAIDALCKRLDLNEVFVHSHPGGTVQGKVGVNWPLDALTSVRAVLVDALTETGASRRMHAKAFEVLCRRGRIVLSGSANATGAALNGQNVEASVARIQRGRLVGWRRQNHSPPEFLECDENEADDAVKVGILRATLEGDVVSGQVLSPAIVGRGTVSCQMLSRVVSLGEAELNSVGQFRVNAPDLELQAWQGGRLTIRVTTHAGAVAEGFLSVAAFRAISQRTGNLITRLLALLSGSETPSDVAAILAWFHNDPNVLNKFGATGSGAGKYQEVAQDENREMLVADLYGHQSGHLPSLISPGNDDGRWRRFIDNIIGALRERRGPLAASMSDSSASDNEREEFTASPEFNLDADMSRSLSIFEELLEALLSAHNEKAHSLTAFDLAGYICDRIRPAASQAAVWLEKLLSVLTRQAIAKERGSGISGHILLAASATGDAPALRRARARLLRLGVDFDGPQPELPLSGFGEVLKIAQSPAVVWQRIKDVRTPDELIRRYLADFGGTSEPLNHAGLTKFNVWRLSQRYSNIVFAEFMTKTIIHDMIHHPYCCFSYTGGEFVYLYTVKLVNVYKRQI